MYGIYIYMYMYVERWHEKVLSNAVVPADVRLAKLNYLGRGLCARARELPYVTAAGAETCRPELCPRKLS